MAHDIEKKSNAVSSFYELKDPYASIVERLQPPPEILNGGDYILWKYDPARASLSTLRSSVNGDLRLGIEDGLVGEAVRKQEPVQALLETSMVAHPQLVQTLNWKHATLCPLYTRGNLVGVVGFYSKSHPIDLDKATRDYCKRILPDVALLALFDNLEYNTPINEEKVSRYEEGLERITRLAESVTAVPHFIHDTSNLISDLSGQYMMLFDYLMARNPSRPIEQLCFGIKEGFHLLRENVFDLQDALHPRRNIRRSKADLSSVCKKAISHCQPFADENRVSIHFIQKIYNVHRKTSAPYIQRLIINGLENSIKALTVRTHINRRIDVVLSGEENSWEIEILDNGIGIAPSDLERVSMPFYSTTDGLGLGLSGMQSIVSSLGGTMSIESELGSFTRVTFSFFS